MQHVGGLGSLQYRVAGVCLGRLTAVSRWKNPMGKTTSIHVESRIFPNFPTYQLPQIFASPRDCGLMKISPATAVESPLCTTWPTKLWDLFSSDLLPPRFPGGNLANRAYCTIRRRGTALHPASTPPVKVIGTNCGERFRGISRWGQAFAGDWRQGCGRELEEHWLNTSGWWLI